MNRRVDDRGVGWGVGLFVLAFAALLVARGEVLWMPLYEDQAVGFGREADFLDQTNFDYRRLRYEETHFLFGGTARSYMVSVLPTALALLHRATESVPTTIFVWHLISFGLAAGIVALTYQLLCPMVGNVLALAAGAAFLTTPMVLVQADVAGMELPLVFCALLAGRSLVAGRPAQALAWGGAAFFMKASGLLVIGALLAVWLIEILVRGREGIRELGRPLLAGIGTVALLLLILAWGDDTAFFRATFQWPSVFKLPQAFGWSPDLILVMLLTLALGIVAAVRWKGELDAAKVGALRLALWSGLIAVGGLVSMAGYIYIPRYCILPLAMTYLLLPLAISFGPVPARWNWIPLVLIAGINLFNHDGRLYPPIARVAGTDMLPMATFTSRSCGFTERSLEYLQDHRSAVRAVQVATQQPASTTIFADMPHWIYLTAPFVGYVPSVPADVVRTDSFSRAIRAFRDRALLEPAEHELLFLWSEKASPRMPMPGEGIETIYRDGLPSPLEVLRVRRESLPPTAQGIEEWYLDRSWDGAHALQRAIDRYEFLRRTGRLERAQRELHLASWLFPNPSDPQVARIIPSLLADVESALAQSVVVDGVRWMLQTGVDVQATIAPDAETGGLRVTTGDIANGRLDSVTLTGPRLFLRKGDVVQIRFRLRGSRVGAVPVFLESIFEPGQEAKPIRTIVVNESWQDFSLEWEAPDDRHDALFRLDLGHPQADFSLANVDVRIAPPRSAAAR